eukprot:Pgem_evm1s5375
MGFFDKFAKKHPPPQPAPSQEFLEQQRVGPGYPTSGAQGPNHNAYPNQNGQNNAFSMPRAIPTGDAPPPAH